ncbi:hypothetical protein [Pendulispora albinea]|uniref:Ferritin n=1 Tax=Pendulispora albinea TaxID=2741071 RepID=A0ABZ2LX15_9BACT
MMPPPPGFNDTVAAIEDLLVSEEESIFAYKIAVLRANATSDIRRFGEFLRARQGAARDLSRVRARLLAKQGTWGQPWETRRLPPGTAQQIGALPNEEGMFDVLASAEDRHASKLVTLLVCADGELPRDVCTLLERILTETEQRRAWLHERGACVVSSAANDARKVASRG